MSKFRKKKGKGKGKSKGKAKGWQSGKSNFATPCFHSHPVLSLGKGKLIGGRCSSPPKDIDVHIGLDNHSMFYHASGGYPWNPPVEDNSPKVLDVMFAITDMSYPKDKEADEFVKMIDWIVEQLNEGKTVHVGCIGGHGRTGMVVAAVINVMLGEKDAVTYARKHYCEKAVETVGQSEFLNKYFDIKIVKGTKQFGGYGGYGGYGSQGGWWDDYGTSSSTGYTKPKQEDKYEQILEPTTGTVALDGEHVSIFGTEPHIVDNVDDEEVV